MSWIASVFIAVLTGTLALFVAGFIGALSMRWYHVSNFEGGSAYGTMAIAIMGGMAGFFLGLVISRFGGGASTPGFFKGLGWSWGAVLIIGAVSTAISFLLADIPPKIDGKYLDLEVEVKLAAGDTNFTPGITTNISLFLGSVVNHVQRKSEKGEVNIEEARRENGRWVIPGNVGIFTMRGKRSIALNFEEKNVAGFLVPLPARPGKKYEEWSDWGPRPKEGTWPETNPSYRFRVRPVTPPPPPPDPAVVDAGQFAGLRPDASLEQWLPFMNNSHASEERTKAIMKQVETRQTELAWLIRTTNSSMRELALSAVPKLTSMNLEVKDAVLTEGREIADGVRKFNEMKSDEPRFWDVQIELRSRFNYWKQAWWVVHQRFSLDGKPPVKEIYDLALVRATETSMDEIEVNARVILEALEPAASAPTASVR
jgi:hypothetical protein